MQIKKKDEGEGFFSAIAGRPAAESFYIEFHGSREVVAEGCLGVVSCSEEQIKLNLGSQTLLVTGCNLIISSMFGRSICIHGRIVSAEFI